MKELTEEDWEKVILFKGLYGNGVVSKKTIKRKLKEKANDHGKKEEKQNNKKKKKDP